MHRTAQLLSIDSSKNTFSDLPEKYVVCIPYGVLHSSAYLLICAKQTLLISSTTAAGAVAVDWGPAGPGTA